MALSKICFEHGARFLLRHLLNQVNRRSGKDPQPDQQNDQSTKSDAPGKREDRLGAALPGFGPVVKRGQDAQVIVQSDGAAQDQDNDKGPERGAYPGQGQVKFPDEAGGQGQSGLGEESSASESSCMIFSHLEMP